MSVLLSVDIKLSSLLDWLQSRRHVKQDWAQKVKEIRVKIAAAIQDMPESTEIKNLLSNTCINYFHCERIVELLKETEKDTQNIFGFYSSQRMKDWQNIVSLYRKDKVFLAESAVILHQLVKYDIPGMIRDLVGIQKNIQEMEAKEQVHKKKALESERVYQEELERRELKGENLRLELLEKTKCIPEQAAMMGNLIVGLIGAVEFYLHYRCYLKCSNNDILPLIRFIQSRGPTATAFAFKYGFPPSKIERPDLESRFLDKGENSEESDNEIDFGDLDCDIGCVEEIDVLNSGEQTAEDQIAPCASIAIGDEALSVMENKATRDLLKHEMKELLSFLKTYAADEKKVHPADMLLVNYLDEPKVAKNDFSNWILIAESVLNDFSNPDKANLYKMFHSPSYIETLVEELTALKAKINFYRESAKLVYKDREELCLKLAERIEDVRAVIVKAKELETQVKQELVQFTDGRPVHFMRGVKSVEATLSQHGF